MTNNNKEKLNEKINVKLGGMELYGTTSNAEVAGYKTSGDIENAGQLDKGFQRVEEEDISATASVKEGEQEEY
ncbi:hypothetical protein NSA56_10525 [Oceanobacillus caeni]|uniref:DUF4025 domain-containing protein n=1 Tax=Oceanobacillus caeni TaxID=405946 RepID=A0ABR5MMU6_9BACI|nr:MULTISPECIES: hypothetical protein [Bacillaceae]KKE78504.1 hypothetical protein WH51_12415 [Bacilli bacterium VT-13-104]PZD85429.1 hypothetical protein DEJ64_09905 [Bacilli bacterium]KPH78231.1 hypothetical protein AFL42_02230 [Oceanobacillus caeni]MBU8791330.1 hypothetical protein [Oceanobacillus caeni]MCR1834832.1 hypothetical protein [Oceanobacillus caeni]